MRRALAGVLLALLVGPSAGAEAVRASGVGTAPLPGTPGASPRAAALDAALADAALRVAAGLVGEVRGPAAEAALREALGPNPGRFALGYRSVSEVERAGASGREIAITIEAQVDRTRVAEALRRAGLLAAQAAAPPPGGDSAPRIVVEPLPSWPALSALRRRLAELGGGRVQLERVEPERAVLSVEGGRSPAQLVSALATSPPPGVSVTPTGDHDGAPRIRLDPGAASLGESAAPIDTPAAKR